MFAVLQLLNTYHYFIDFGILLQTCSLVFKTLQSSKDMVMIPEACLLLGNKLMMSQQQKYFI